MLSRIRKTSVAVGEAVSEATLAAASNAAFLQAGIGGKFGHGMHFLGKDEYASPTTSLRRLRSRLSNLRRIPAGSRSRQRRSRRAQYGAGGRPTIDGLPRTDEAGPLTAYGFPTQSGRTARLRVPESRSIGNGASSGAAVGASVRYGVP